MNLLGKMEHLYATEFHGRAELLAMSCGALGVLFTIFYYWRVLEPAEAEGAVSGRGINSFGINGTLTNSIASSWCGPLWSSLTGAGRLTPGSSTRLLTI